MTKVWIAILILAIVLGGGLTFFIIKSSQQSSNNEQVAVQELKQPVEEVGTKSYKDESGFSFDYPDTLTAKDITPNDDSYYSLVDISKGGKSIKITVQDGTYKVSENAKLVGSVTLGGLTAKQYSYKDDLITFVNKEGIMYVVEGPDDKEFWTKTQNAIVDSFVIGNTKTSSTSSGGGDVIEEEEVVE